MTTKVNADVVDTLTTLTASALTVSGTSTLQNVTYVGNAISNASGTSVTHNLSLGNLFYHTSVAGNFTVNLTNVPTTNNRMFQVTLVITQGATGYYPNGFRIDGVVQTINWYGVTPVPTSTNGAVDLAVFTVMRSGTTAAWRVHGNYYNAQNNFGKTQIRSLGVGTVAADIATISDGEIRATSEVTAYYASDENLKENIQVIENALGKVRQIQGVMFDWTDEAMATRGGEDGYFVRKHDTGIIAQKVNPVLPEVVARRPDGYLAVRYEKLAGLIIQSINELADQLDELKKKVG